MHHFELDGNLMTRNIMQAEAQVRAFDSSREAVSMGSSTSGSGYPGPTAFMYTSSISKVASFRMVSSNRG